MIKFNILLFSALWMLATVASAQNSRIDSLQTMAEVQSFVVEKFGYWKEITDRQASVTDTSKFGKNRFFKLDFNKDDRKDLLVNARYLYAVTDKGDGTYALHFIDQFDYRVLYQLLDIIDLDRQPCLIVRAPDRMRYLGFSGEKADTLIFRYGKFMEYNPQPEDLQFDSLSFFSNLCYDKGCYGCQFKLYSDRSAVYEVLWHGKKRVRKAAIDTASFQRITDTINYMKLNMLPSNYQVGWSDTRSGTLSIGTSGQVKVVKSDGLIGTFGLLALFDQITELRTTQLWKKTFIN